MEVTQLERVFVFKNDGVDMRLSDPSERFSPEEVLNYYSRLYPLLTNAHVGGRTIVNDEEQYRFESKIGTKG